MDFFLPEKNICIEYDGIQHFEPRSRFGGDKEFEIQKVRDSRKNDYCNKKNIRLIRISYKDYSKLNTILNTVLNENIINFKEFILFF
jgi:very-short-patch-repair endonuclease